MTFKLLKQSILTMNLSFRLHETSKTVLHPLWWYVSCTSSRGIMRDAWWCSYSQAWFHRHMSTLWWQHIWHELEFIFYGQSGTFSTTVSWCYPIYIWRLMFCLFINSLYILFSSHITYSLICTYKIKCLHTDY